MMAVVLVLVTLCVFVAGYEQKFAIEPMDQTAVVGSRVTLPCRVINKTGLLQWSRNGFGLGADRDLPDYPRYTMIGTDDEGDFSLDINPVELEDDAKFQCQVASNSSVGRIQSRKANLVVLVPPSLPVIIQGKHLETTEDRPIELECVSRAGKPAAEITWIDGNGTVIKDGIEVITELLADKRVTTKSILKFTPKKEHHKQTFTCQAQNQANIDYQKTNLTLSVKFAPKVTVRVISPASGKIHEFSEVRFACHAEANPADDLVYKWYVNDEPVVQEVTTELLLPNVTREMHYSIVKCEVHNAVGKSEESETLDINYGPRLRTKPKSVQAEQGSMIVLTCDVDSNPPAEIVWIHEDTGKIVGTSANLSFTLTPDNAGRYKCRAFVPDFLEFPEVSALAHVYLKGPPTIISNRVQVGPLGDNVRIECVVFSVPRPEKVVWSRYGYELHASGNSEFTVLEDQLPEGLKSTLVIRDSKTTHFGNYNCTATNQFGIDVAEIRLKQQEGFKYLEMIFYTVIFCIVVVILFGICCLCKRKKKPKMPDIEIDPPEKQSGKHSDRSSNDSDLKVEIRTASSLSNVHEGESEPGNWDDHRSDAPTPRLGNGADIYRYSSEFTDPNFPPKTDGHNNNGYVSFANYNRDYNPPIELQRNSIVYGLPPASTATTILNSDPRYSATYGNPYLRTSTNSLPHPHHSPAGSSPGSVKSPPSQPPPPAYSAATATRNGAVPQVSRLPNSPTSQFIVPNSQASIKRGTLATHV